MQTTHCSLHPDVPATNTCGVCGKALCAPCTVFEGGRDRCPACVTAYFRAKKTRATVLIAVGVLGVAGGAVAAVHALRSSPAAPTAPAAPAFNYGDKAQTVIRQRFQLEQEPCSKPKVLQLTQTLLAAHDYAGTLQVVDGFDARCGKFTQLRQAAYTAHTQLEQLELAVKDATALIDSAPKNPGYRLWRGMAYEALKQDEAALADFEAAFQSHPDQVQIANVLVRAYEKRSRPCDELRTRREHLRANPQAGGGAPVEKRMADLEAAGKCGAAGGAPPGAAPIK